MYCDRDRISQRASGACTPLLVQIDTNVAGLERIDESCATASPVHVTACKDRAELIYTEVEVAPASLRYNVEYDVIVQHLLCLQDTDLPQRHGRKGR